MAPDTDADPAEDAPDALPASADTLSEDELDALVAPVALYPDALLAQVLMATTYPLDVMKAESFLDQNAGLDDKERAKAVADKDWDERVRTLAAGFPDVLGRMADHIDWTEDIGDALLAQPDDLLDATQRMRARAEAVGNLASNAAQTVTSDGDQIDIAPADPKVVYVPTYDPATTYTTPAAQAPVVYQDPGLSMSTVLTTGAIAFGSALLIDEIFDDDDDWDDYWHGPGPIDWDDHALYPRRDIDINGDVDIDVNRGRIGDRDGDELRRAREWKPDAAQRDAARERIRDGGERPRADPGRQATRTQAEAKLRARSGEAGLEAPRARKAGTPGAHQGAAASALKPGGGGAAKARARAETSGAHHPGAHQAAKQKPKAIAKKPAQAERRAPPRKPAAHEAALRKPKVSKQRSHASINRGHRR